LTAPEKIKILYIDDEINNLVGFKATFRYDYKVYTANNTSEAYNHLSQQPDLRVVFCDQRMPDKTGVQFFAEIHKLFPHPVRILLTGYADIESVIEAINQGHIFRYVKKPWIDAEILSAIEEGNRYYLINSMIAIKNEELQEAYDELDKFYYSVTHDIRRPLLSIIGAIDVAQYIDNIVELKEMLHLMEESVKNLDIYIQNIHDYYNLKRGELIIEEINFDDIINVQKNTFDSVIRKGDIRFVVTILQHEFFRSDKPSVSMIINNLLSNAFKYQRNGEQDKFVKLDIKIENGFLTIIIEDNGIGIDKNYIPQIFNMFFRATTGEIGSGFGLYNVKHALTKLNGLIKVDTTLGTGSVFTVTIPNK